MFYYFVKFICKIGFRINFRKVYLHYQAELPKNKAIIFAANHPTAFLDPVMIGAYLDRPTYFIVRGDIFKGKFILAILNALKLLPIFRFRDGYSNLKNNQATMDTVYQKLSEQRCVLVLAEGQTKHEKRLRPIQKGTARMAFGAIEKHQLEEIYIVPIGVNYTDSHQFRSFMMTIVGKPIDLRDYIPMHQENPRKAIKQLTDRIETDMRALVTHIEAEADDVWIDQMLSIKRGGFRDLVFPIKSSDPSLWEGEFAAVEKMNAFEASKKAEVTQVVQDYEAQLEKHKVSNLGVARPEALNISNTLLLVLGFPLLIVGAFLNCLPMLFAKGLADQKVKQIEFYSSVRFGAGLVGYLIYWLLWFIISLIIGNAWLIGLVLAMPFLGYFTLVYWEILERWHAARLFKMLDKKQQKALQEQRRALMSYID